MTTSGEGDVNVSREVAASPDVLWDMVTDLPRMDEWSPESQGGSWKGGITKPAVGARLSGANRNGLFRWKTTATVVEMVPKSTFAFDIGVFGIRVANWRYEIEPTDSGCTVTEIWTDGRAKWFSVASIFATGVSDRAAHNRETMEATLEALGAAAEATPAAT